MSSVFEIKIVSSLEKCFMDESIDQKPALEQLRTVRDQRICFQVLLTKPTTRIFRERFTVSLTGSLAPHATMRRVVNVPVHYPCMNGICDDGYLRKTPGLYPDLLRPLHYRNGVTLTNDQLHAIWVEAILPPDFPAGAYTLGVEVRPFQKKDVVAQVSIPVELCNAALPPQRLIHTEWFYTDCIANQYHVRAFSEKHWKLIESFLRTAVSNGVNMILTPVFTPELDTYIGGERLTTQLLDITVTAPDQYAFRFDRLNRWIDLCHSVGATHFEIPHFFTQWGANHAPKFVATVNGRKKKIFGWETDACGPAYRTFLSQMIPALVAFLEEKGVAQNTFFHVSDEPSLKALDRYKECKEQIKPHLKDYPIIDALSDYDFYESGALEKPVPGIRSIQPFLDHKVPGLWAYYCGDSGTNVSGRMIAMPLGRTRILGIQLWLHRIEGFLHWGYNFYNNQYSYDTIDPFLHTDGEFFAPSGDTFLVYPGDNGTPWESMRLNAIREGMEDMRLLDLAAERLGRERVEAILLEEAGGTLTFTSYPTEPKFFHSLHDRLLSEAGL